MYTTDIFRKIAMESRFELLRSYSFYSRKKGVSSAEAGYAITQEAIKRGFIEHRKPIPGTTFSGWIRDKKTPAWPIKAALFLLMDIPEFFPTENQKIAIALTLAELFPDFSEASLVELLKGSLEHIDWSELIHVACLARKRGLYQ